MIREWVARFAVNCGQQLSEARVLLWIDELSDIEPDRLIAAFRAVMRSHTFNSIPQIGDIRAKIDQAESNGLELRAVQAWEHALGVAESDGRGFQALDAATQHAILAAGGLHWMESCPEQELQWAKKRFLEDFKLVHETRQTEHLLSDGEAKQIVRQLAAKRPRPRALSPVTVPTATAALPPDDPIRAEFAALREQLNRPEPMPTKTEAELESRRELLKRQAAQILGEQVPA